jgi:hypothetical protein
MNETLGIRKDASFVTAMQFSRLNAVSARFRPGYEEDCIGANSLTLRGRSNLGELRDVKVHCHMDNVEQPSQFSPSGIIRRERRERSLFHSPV